MVSRWATTAPNPLWSVRAHVSGVMKLKNRRRRWRAFGISLFQLGKVSANLCKGLYAPLLCPFSFCRVKCQVHLLMPDWISFESADTTARTQHTCEGMQLYPEYIMLTAALQAVTSLATVIPAVVGDQHRKASSILKNTQTKEQHMRGSQF